MTETISALPELERASTVSQIHRILRRAIIDGAIPAGAQLRESQVASRLGTGRGAVREAIRHLVEEGLVEYTLHRGAFVRVLSPAECLDVYLAREAIETWVARRIVESDHDFDFSPLQSAITKMETPQPPDGKPTEEMIAADLRFHHELVRLIGSPRLTRAHETLAAETRILLRLHPEYPKATNTRDHQRILDALVRRDPDAPALLAEHLRLSARLNAGQIGNPDEAAGPR